MEVIILTLAEKYNLPRRLVDVIVNGRPISDAEFKTLCQKNNIILGKFYYTVDEALDILGQFDTAKYPPSVCIDELVRYYSSDDLYVVGEELGQDVSVSIPELSYMLDMDIFSVRKLIHKNDYDHRGIRDVVQSKLGVLLDKRYYNIDTVCRVLNMSYCEVLDKLRLGTLKPEIDLMDKFGRYMFSEEYLLKLLREERTIVYPIGITMVKKPTGWSDETVRISESTGVLHKNSSGQYDRDEVEYLRLRSMI